NVHANFKASQKLVTTQVTTVETALNEKLTTIGEVGQNVELAEDSIFERKDGKIVLKSTFTEAIQKATTSEEIDTLKSQLEAAQTALVQAAQGAQTIHDKKIALDKQTDEVTRIQNRDKVNENASEKYNFEIQKTKGENQSNFYQTLSTPLSGKINNIQTSLRLLNDNLDQIGSMHNKDKVSIVGIRWEESGEKPLSYLIDLDSLQKRLKKKHKGAETGYVSAKYVKLDDAAVLEGLRATQTQTNQDRSDLVDRNSKVKSILTTLNEVVSNTKDFVDVDSHYVFGSKITPNDKFVLVLKNLHIFLITEDTAKKANSQRRNELKALVENFFTDKKVDQAVKAETGFSDSGNIKALQSRMKLILDWTKDYSDDLNQ
ncbi:hypothetical protein MJH12_10865, partial [bacterium]|nr:hypothetical protein [bacterium]